MFRQVKSSTCLWRQLLGLYQVGDIWSWVQSTGRIILTPNNRSTRNPSQCYFVHYQSHTHWPGIEPRLPWWKTNRLCHDTALFRQEIPRWRVLLQEAAIAHLVKKFAAVIKSDVNCPVHKHAGRVASSRLVILVCAIPLCFLIWIKSTFSLSPNNFIGNQVPFLRWLATCFGMLVKPSSGSPITKMWS